VPRKEFVSSRAKIGAALFVCIVFVAIALLMPELPRGSQPWRIAATVFFGVGALVFGFLMLRPQRLILDSDGFTVTGGLVFSPKPIRWSDVDRFFVYRLPKGGKMIGFNYRAGARGTSALLDFNRRSAGADGALPGLWRGGPEKIVEELNDYRERSR